MQPHGVQIRNYALNLPLMVNSADQRSISKGGAQTVEALKIDDIGGHPTLIKMDIEGAEEAALEGARCTILDRKPKLTFSIYHRPFDPIILTEKVLSIRSDYKFYMRHHTMGIWDTVLYAI